MTRSNAKLVPYAAVIFLAGIAIGGFSDHQRWLGQQASFLNSMGTTSTSSVVPPPPDDDEAAPVTTFETSPPASSEEEEEEEAEVTTSPLPKTLPDWRLTTECSAFSRECIARKLTQYNYTKYPFHVGKAFDHLYQWKDKLPEGWETSLREHIPPKSIATKHEKSDEAIDQCVDVAQGMSVDDQLDALLKELGRTKNDMVSFAITDYSYSYDMIHDVYAMAHNVVGFRDAFFLVAMDVKTMQLCCRYGYPFVAWPQEKSKSQEGVLKKSVANSKFEVSYKLLLRNQAFFFFEMDVWFVQSPQPHIAKQTADIVFSGHQNNPAAANIGVYSVLATDASREFFHHSISLITQSPDTHDQLAMQQLTWFLNELRDNPKANLTFSGHWKEPIPKVPKFKHPAKIRYYSAHEIVADTHPVVSGDTLAIHPLCGVPLRTPHGKKMIAKELSAWYGADGYYDGKENRYLWLDGHVWNGYSNTMNWPEFYPHIWYHNERLLRVTIATTVALARRTGRIWVIPKYLNDYGVHLLWLMLDMKSVEALVDVRETNFPTNPKSWHNHSVPYHPVARSALGDGGRIYAQLQADGTTTDYNILTWKANDLADKPSGTTALDAWFAIHHTIPELDQAQVLLAGIPAARDFVDNLRATKMAKRALSVAEQEVVEVFERLRWCKMSFEPKDLAGGEHVRAEEDCWGEGQPAKWEQ